MALKYDSTTNTLSNAAGDSIGVKIATAGSDRLVFNNDGTWYIGGSSGTAGQVLTSNGANAAPTWQTPVSGLADPGSNGLVIRTSLGVTTSRTITGTTNQITVSDGDGVSANPTVAIASNPVIPGTAAMQIPQGTQGQRPGSPQGGMIRYDLTATIFEGYQNGAWVPMITSTVPYDIGFSVVGKPDDNATIVTFVAPRLFTITANFAGSQSKAGVAATFESVFTIRKNGAQIGTITYDSASSVGVFAGAAASFAVGDILTVNAPTLQDSTLANIGISFFATTNV